MNWKQFFVLPDGCIHLDTEAGIFLGFTSDKFHKASYLWKVGRTISISAIMSLERGKGYFRGLVENLLQNGFTIHIPTPLPEMGRIVQKQGYRFLRIISEKGTFEVWQMTPKQWQASKPNKDKK